MTVEYVLLVSLFVLFLGSALWKGPYGAFQGAGPKLGARVEKHLMTGDGFGRTPSSLSDSTSATSTVKQNWVD